MTKIKKIIKSAGEDMEKLLNLSIAGGNVKVQSLWKTVAVFDKFQHIFII